MLGKSGFVKRVDRGVDAALEPGEQRQVAVYVRGQNGNIALVSLLGPAVTQPFILAVTDRRVLLLAMGQFNAAHSSVIASIPRQHVRVTGFEAKGLNPSIQLGLQSASGPVAATFHLVPAWKKEAADFAQAVGWAPSY